MLKFFESQLSGNFLLTLLAECYTVLTAESSKLVYLVY